MNNCAKLKISDLNINEITAEARLGIPPRH